MSSVTSQVVSGTFTATGQSASFTPIPGSNKAQQHGAGYFNMSLWGTFTATVKLQRSFDAGTTWLTVSQDATGADASYTAALSVVAIEPETGVLYRLNCTAYSSGTVNYRISR